MRHLKLLLKTLFSNNACVEAARTKEAKYHIFAILFALFAIFFAVLPTPIKAFQVNGSAFMSSTYNYNMDTSYYKFSEHVAKAEGENAVKFTISVKDNRKTLTVDNFNGNSEYEAKIKRPDHKGYLNGLYRYTYYDSRNDKVGLEVYVYPQDSKTYTEDKLATFTSYILSNLNPVLKMENPDLPDDQAYLDYTVKDGKATQVARSTSFIVFGTHTVYAYGFQPNNTTAIGGIAGDYNHTDNGEFIKSMFVDVATKSDGVKLTYENWKTFFNNSYIDIRFRNAWQSTGIMIGVDCGVLIFMGLMVFILTRGKNNPFRIYSFWDSQKIAYYSCLTPGLIALGLGFLISNMAMMFFILMLGIRVMWLSMRTLRYNPPSK